MGSVPGASSITSALRQRSEQPPRCVCPKEAEALETETKLFEDLEFQQLERESRLEEERETRSQQLLQSRAEYHRSIAHRKVGPGGSRQLAPSQASSPLFPPQNGSTPACPPGPGGCPGCSGCPDPSAERPGG